MRNQINHIELYKINEYSYNMMQNININVNMVLDGSNTGVTGVTGYGLISTRS